MILELGEQRYHQEMIELYRLSIGEARVIKRQTGMTIADWRMGLATIQREDPDIFAGLVFLFRGRAGETVNWDQIDATGAQDLVAGLQFDEGDRELMAKLLPGQVDWLSLKSSAEVQAEMRAAADLLERSAAVEVVELPEPAEVPAEPGNTATN